MDVLRRLYWRLGTPDAISWQTVVTVLFFHTSGSVLTSGVDFEGRFFEFLLVRFAGLMVLFAVLGLGKLALISAAKRRPQPLITFLTFVVGLSVGTAVFDALLVYTAFTDQPFLARRLLLTLFALLSIMVLVSAVVTTAREFAAKNDSLVESIHQLQETQVDTHQRIVDHRVELIDGIRRLMAEKLDHLSLNISNQAQTMRTLIDDVIRPVSYSIAQASPTAPTTKQVANTARIPWRKVVTVALQGSPFSRLVLPLTIGLVVSGFLVLTFRVPGVLATVSIVVFALVTNSVWRHVWPPVSRTLPSWALVVAFTLAATPLLWGSIWIIDFFTGFDLTAPYRLVPWAIIVLLTWWSSALSVSVFQLLQEVSDQLDVTLSELRREVAGLNGALRMQQKIVSRALHGPIQVAVTSSLHKLSTDPNLVTDESFVETLRQRIELSLEALATPEVTTTPLSKVLADTKEVWEGVTDIRLTVSPNTFAAVETHPQISSALSELVTEAVSNAVKHGHAKKVTISLNVDSTADTVTLKVDNDGLPVPPHATAGLGSSLFDDLCVEWSRRSQSGMTTVTAVVPMVGREH